MNQDQHLQELASASFKKYVLDQVIKHGIFDTLPFAEITMPYLEINDSMTLEEYASRLADELVKADLK